MSSGIAAYSKKQYPMHPETRKTVNKQCVDRRMEIGRLHDEREGKLEKYKKTYPTYRKYYAHNLATRYPSLCGRIYKFFKLFFIPSLNEYSNNFEKMPVENRNKTLLTYTSFPDPKDFDTHCEAAQRKIEEAAIQAFYKDLASSPAPQFKTDLTNKAPLLPSKPLEKSNSTPNLMGE